MAGTTAKVCVAELGPAHGVRGEVKLRAFTTDPAALLDYSPLESAHGRSFVLEGLRVQGDSLVGRFKGLTSREAVEALRGEKLYVPRDRLPPAEDDEFYHADLIGLRAATPEGEELGSVTALWDFGAGDIIEIVAPGQKPLLLPFTKAVVPMIDIANGCLTVVPPLEIEAKPEGAEASDDAS